MAFTSDTLGDSNTSARTGKDIASSVVYARNSGNRFALDNCVSDSSNTGAMLLSTVASPFFRDAFWLQSVMSYNGRAREAVEPEVLPGF